MIIYFENENSLYDQYKIIKNEIDFHINYNNTKFKVLLDLIGKLSFQYNLKNLEKFNNLLFEIHSTINIMQNIHIILYNLKSRLIEIFNNSYNLNTLELTDEIKNKINNFNDIVTEFIKILYISYTQYDNFIKKNLIDIKPKKQLLN
ncbi:MAG: hypothetical protein IKM97_03215 [Clostridia bacterium]|nr:hypothetical protein [Clostridia bacterium]